jgi:hypothetical protein
MRFRRAAVGRNKSNKLSLVTSVTGIWVLRGLTVTECPKRETACLPTRITKSLRIGLRNLLVRALNQTCQKRSSRLHRTTCDGE